MASENSRISSSSFPGTCDTETDTRSATQLLSVLAAEERRHIEVFRRLREGRSLPISRAEANNVLDSFRRTIADDAVFNMNEDPGAELEGLSLVDIMRVALQRARDAIAFYGTMRELMSLDPCISRFIIKKSLSILQSV